jgi:alkylation response protein AidB-like acyl-CoA dehydrogenase
MLDFKLTEEQRQMVESVRALVQEKFKPRVPKWQDGTFPWENMHELGKMGILGMAVPEEYGGLGLPVLDTVLVVEEVSKVCYVSAMALIGELGVQVRAIAEFAPEEVKRDVLPKIASGETILAVCITEPHAGTDVPAMRTNTTIKGDRIIVNGTKTLISRADEAAIFVVFTRVDKTPGREGIGCVLVPSDAPGFKVTARYHTMGGENLAEIQFDNVELPLENLIVRDNGFRRLINAFNTQRCLNPSVSLGLAEGAFEESVKYARNRTAFGKSIAEFQGMRWKIADMYKDIEVGRSILYRACSTANPFPDPHMAGVAKMYCNEMALRVTSEAIQVHGGYGFTNEYPVSGFYRGARYGTLGGGTTETLKDLIGKRVIADFPEDGFLNFKTY